MRRVNVSTGLKQRVNDILGQSDVFDGSITPWSIQAAMLSNVQRVAQAIVGEAQYGRVMKGLSISYGNSTSVLVSSGYGITPDGYVVTLAVPLLVQISQYTSGNVYVYLKYSLIAAPGSSNAYGKNTTFNSMNVSEEIVYDESGLVNGTQAVAQGFIETDTKPPASRTTSNGYIYLGSINVDGTFSSTSLIINTFDVGFLSLTGSNTGYYQDISNAITITPVTDTATVVINHAYFYKQFNTNNLDISFDLNGFSSGTPALTKVIIALPDICKCASRYALSPTGNYFFSVLNDTNDDTDDSIAMNVCGYFYNSGSFNIIRPYADNTHFTTFLASNTSPHNARFSFNISYEQASS